MIYYIEKDENGDIKHINDSPKEKTHDEMVAISVTQNAKEGFERWEILEGREAKIAGIRVSDYKAVYSRIDDLIESLDNIDHELSGIRSELNFIAENKEQQ